MELETWSFTDKLSVESWILTDALMIGKRQLNFTGHWIDMPSDRPGNRFVNYKFKISSSLRPGAQRKKYLNKISVIKRMNQKDGGRPIWVKPTFNRVLEEKASGSIFSVRLIMIIKMMMNKIRWKIIVWDIIEKIHGFFFIL